VNEKREELSRIRAKVDVNSLENAEIKEFYAKIYAELGDYPSAVRIFEELLTTEQADFSVTSLEQYCSLRSKLLVSMYRENQPYRQDVTQLIRDLKVMRLMGETSERLALLASVYKRAAIVSRGKARQTYLEKMKEHFERSFVRTATFPLEDRVYSLSNYLIAKLGLRTDSANLQAIGPIEEFMAVYGADFYGSVIKQLTEEADSYKDYYKRNAVVKMLVCQYLDESNTPEQAQTIFDHLKIEMRESIRLYANIKHILGEKEQLQFITDLLPEGVTKTQLEHLRREVEGWLNPLDNPNA